MGFALARAALSRGADVTIVAGSTSAPPPAGGNLIRVESAEEMYSAVMQEVAGSTVFVGAAAVADYRPKNKAATKIKKKDLEEMILELERTPDILAAVSAGRRNGQIVAGFAAETTNILEYAKEKLDKKGLDLVVANDITKPGAGFDTDTNIATIITKGSNDPEELPLMSKLELADRILDRIVGIRNESK